VLNEILGLHNKPKAVVNSVHKLTGPKEEEEEEEEKKKKKKKKKKKRSHILLFPRVSWQFYQVTSFKKFPNGK